MQNIIQLIAILALLLSTNHLKSQSTPYCLGEEVTLKTLEIYRGNYQWEFSSDNVTWSLASESTQYTFTLNSQTTGYYRLKITEADCEDIISDFQEITYSSTITDIEGNSYTVFQYNNQCWMAENLRTSKYNDESVIPEISNESTWISLNSGAWCYLDNSSNNNAIHGKLYNWYAINDSRKICPIGWHVPTEEEWQTFEFNLGMDSQEPMNGWRGDANNVGGKMKSTDLWNAPNTGANNESGFTGLSGGYRSHSNGNYLFTGMLSYWWSSTGNETNAWARGLSHNIGAVHRINGNNGSGFYVRCIKD